MVTVVQKPISKKQALFKSIGGGLNSAMSFLGPQFQKEMERNKLKEALGQAQDVFNDPEKGPLEKMLAYKSAMAGFGDKAESKFLDSLMQMTAMQGGAKNLRPPGQSGEGQPSNAGIPGQPQGLQPANVQTPQNLASVLSQADQYNQQQYGVMNAVRNQGGGSLPSFGLQQRPGSYQGSRGDLPAAQTASMPANLPQQAPNVSPVMRELMQDEQQLQDTAVPSSPPASNPFANLTSGRMPFPEATGANRAPKPGEVNQGYYSPQEISETRRQELSQGLSQTPKTELMKQHNAELLDAKKRETGLESDRMGLAQQRMKFDNSWLQDAISKNPTLKDNVGNLHLFNQISTLPVFENIDNQEKRFNAVNDMYNKYQSFTNEIHKRLQRSNWNDVDYNTTKNLIKAKMPFFVNNGMRPQIQKELAEIGYGKIEIAEMTEPLLKDSEKILSKAPEFHNINKIYNDLLENEEYLTPEMKTRGFNEIDNSRNELNTQWRDLIKYSINNRSNVITNAGTFEPGPNLLLIRQKYLESGGRMHDFVGIVTDMMNNGEISLDLHQMEQLPYVNENPIKSLGIWQSLLNMVPGYIQKR